MPADARVALLERLIDHAALFPPASMSVQDALAEDSRLRASEDAFVVGRFVVPASRLAELADEPLPLSVVVDDGLSGKQLLAHERAARVEAYEAPRGTDPGGLAGLAAELYVELPADLDRLVELGLRAKVRCGGAHVPSVEELAGVVRGCRERRLVFKATAGLHHAVRIAGEHGFLNLLAACAFPGFEEAALADEDPSAFRLQPHRFAWRGNELDAEEAARLRRELFAGFGSCSVAEPIADLRALGMLPL